MIFPNTRVTLLERLKDASMTGRWNFSWEEFFDLYHEAVRVCVHGAFRRNGWYSVNEADVQDVVMSVFESILKCRDSLEPDSSKGRFRQFLVTVCQRRVVDYIRSHKPTTPAKACSESHDQDASVHEEQEARKEFESREEQAFRKTGWKIAMETLHDEVSPQVYMIFERVKLNEQSPADVAVALAIKRGVVDNSIYKALQKLRDICQRPGIKEELLP